MSVAEPFPAWPTALSRPVRPKLINGGQIVALFSDSVYVDINSTGAPADASGVDSVAIGGDLVASGAGSVALGENAVASHTNSVALGSGSVSTANNQVNVGGRTIGGVANGVGGTDAVNFGQLTGVSNRVTTLEALAVDFDDRLDAVGDRVTTLEALAVDFDDRLDDLDDKASAGTATAIAMGGTTFLPGKAYNLSGNMGYYDGAWAAALNFGALVSEDVAVNAGMGYGFSDGGEFGARLGFTWGW